MARRARPHFWTPQRSSEIWGILLFFGSLFLLMCLLSFHSDDSSFFTSRPSVHIHNLGGMVGASVAGAMMLVMGVTSYLLVGLGFLWSLARFQGKPPQRLQIKILSTILFCVAVSSLLYVLWVHVPDVKFFYRGGMIGTWAGNHLLNYFGWWGAVVVLFTVGLLCLLLSTELEIWPALSRAIKSFKMPKFSIRTKAPIVRGLEKRKEKEQKEREWKYQRKNQ